MPTVLGAVLPTEQNVVQTTDATQTVLATVEVPDDTTLTLTVWVSAFRTGTEEVAGFQRRIVAKRFGGGGAALVDLPDEDFERLENSAWDVDVDVSGNNVEVKVTGEAAKTINWTSRHLAVFGS